MTVLLFLFQFGFPFISLSSLAIARTSKTVLNKSGISGHLCLVPEIREKAFSFSSLSILLAVGDRDIRGLASPWRQGSPQAGSQPGSAGPFPSPQTESRWSHWVGSTALRFSLLKRAKLRRQNMLWTRMGWVLVTYERRSHHARHRVCSGAANIRAVN